MSSRAASASSRRARSRSRAHHAGSLGGEREHVEGLLQGSVHVASPGQGLLAGWYRPAEVWTHPYLFKDVPHKNRVWDTMRAEYTEAIAKTRSCAPIAAIPRMPRQLSCNKVVKTPDDLKGLKIRVPETALWRRTFELMGASPTPLPFPEVFQALKSRIIDGQENPIALTYNAGIFDVNTHLSLTEHMMQDNCLADGRERRISGSRPSRRRMSTRPRATWRPSCGRRSRPTTSASSRRSRRRRSSSPRSTRRPSRKSVAKLVEEFPAGKRWVERIADDRLTERRRRSGTPRERRSRCPPSSPDCATWSRGSPRSSSARSSARSWRSRSPRCGGATSSTRRSPGPSRCRASCSSGSPSSARRCSTASGCTSRSTCSWRRCRGPGAAASAGRSSS